MQRMVPVAFCGLCLALALGSGAARAGNTDEEFLAKLIAAQLAEIKMAETAMANTNNDDVKRYAKRLADDHTKFRNDLLDRARVLKVNVVLELDKDLKGKMDRLAKLRGAELDREYIKMMIDDHQMDIRELESRVKTVRDEELRKVVTNALPTMREHLKQAQSLSTSVK